MLKRIGESFFINIYLYKGRKKCTIFLGSKITVDGDCSHKIKRCLLLGRKATTNQASMLKSRDITLLTKVWTVKAMFFSSSHAQMWELDHKEEWEPKNWCFWGVVPQKTLESPLDSKEINPVKPKGNQPWIINGMTDAKAPILWSPDPKSQLIRKDWGQKEKGATEDETVGWSHQLNGQEFEQCQEMVKDTEA